MWENLQFWCENYFPPSISYLVRVIRRYCKFRCHTRGNSEDVVGYRINRRVHPRRGGNLFGYEITLTDNFAGKRSNRPTEFTCKNYRCPARIAIPGKKEEACDSTRNSIIHLLMNFDNPPIIFLEKKVIFLIAGKILLTSVTLASPFAV